MNKQQKFRKEVLDNTPSNNGWHTNPNNGKKFRAKDGEADHIWPKAKGGPNNAKLNGQFVDKEYNRSKSDKIDSRTVTGFLNKIFG